MVQDFTGVPSTNTVQAPQWVVSHPMWVPVSLSFSRRKCTRRSRGSTSAVRFSPLTVTVIDWLMFIHLLGHAHMRASVHARQRPGQRYVCTRPTPVDLLSARRFPPPGRPPP